ncbi:MAG: hypothetical protein A2031_08575 [Deltaproteobacteria bacterium RBG_19FT_COMBO_43_11]|nr:MAG: hypothetical protein A2031_08575 [Deltaproteobacteria bacterium RBG_19FT_COMBO_43_11]
MKKIHSFTRKDIEQMKALGLSPSAVEKQLALYRRGTNFFKLNRPCTSRDGILSFTGAQREKLIKKFESEGSHYKLLKFVPASGAASRMFADWFAAAEKGSFGDDQNDRLFFADLGKMPFFPLLERDKVAREYIRQKNVKCVLDFILLSDGLNFGWLPKALIPFHKYPKGEIRTALEEHLFEAASYIVNDKGVCRLHFTISAEHTKNVKEKLKDVKKKYESLCNVKFSIQLSIQTPNTDMLAVDENDQPIRDVHGHLVFRPGGHGALLTNLNSLDADFIFVKNIDNIVPAHFLRKILPHKKMLGGLALQLQQSIFNILRDLEKSGLTSEKIKNIVDYCRLTMNYVFPENFVQQSLAEQKRMLVSLLNRPLRICGVVRNVGEPGGGPFWVEEKDKTQTLQIVEIGHIDQQKVEQLIIWSQASYFNPVDMVCCIKNYRGKKFDLKKFVNHDAYLISSKTQKGRKIKAQEMPGLWNGGMAYWNTFFVELPLAVFNPVKTVYDLLRPQHRNSKKTRETK